MQDVNCFEIKNTMLTIIPNNATSFDNKDVTLRYAHSFYINNWSQSKVVIWKQIHFLSPLKEHIYSCITSNSKRQKASVYLKI